ncbi:MAG: putative nicotinate-nucleotide adenylyltransferase [Calditrichaeota bacterium]|nr:putative nicotinate-nucleotide adenylyltransferase [Calditrichota bacterium]
MAETEHRSQETRPASTGLFGGSFDPPTVAHLIIPELVRDQLALGAVWLVPAWVNPLKLGRTHAPPEIRLEMIRAAVKNVPYFQVIDYEIRRGEASYTIDTVRRLKRDHPGREFTLILGADSVATLPRWKQYRELIDSVRIAAVVRPGWSLADLPAGVRRRIHPVEIPPLPLSSTMIRERIARGRSVRFLVPDRALEIIESRALYR